MESDTAIGMAARCTPASHFPLPAIISGVSANSSQPVSPPSPSSPRAVDVPVRATGLTFEERLMMPVLASPLLPTAQNSVLALLSTDGRNIKGDVMVEDLQLTEGEQTPQKRKHALSDTPRNPRKKGPHFNDADCDAILSWLENKSNYQILFGGTKARPRGPTGKRFTRKHGFQMLAEHLNATTEGRLKLDWELMMNRWKNYYRKLKATILRGKTLARANREEMESECPQFFRMLELFKDRLNAHFPPEWFPSEEDDAAANQNGLPANQNGDMNTNHNNGDGVTTIIVRPARMITRPGPKPVTELVSEPIAKSKQTAKPFTKPVAKRPYRRAIKPGVKPVLEPVSKPVAEPDTDPDTDPDSDPDTDPENEPENGPGKGPGNRRGKNLLEGEPQQDSQRSVTSDGHMARSLAELGLARARVEERRVLLEERRFEWEMAKAERREARETARFQWDEEEQRRRIKLRIIQTAIEKKMTPEELQQYLDLRF